MEEKGLRRGHLPWGVISHFLSLCLSLSSWWALVLTRKTEKDRETESEKSPPGEMAMLQSLLLRSPLRILGTHAHVPGVSFKPPGPGLELRSITWESSDIAIMLTAGSLKSYLLQRSFLVRIFPKFYIY